jgi:Holliday junction resolvase RusA-like endonuclease
MIKMVVKSKPKPQGRPRVTKWGTYDPSKKDKIEFMMQIPNKPNQPITDSIYLKVKFTMPYPKKWYRTGKFAGILKDNAPVEHVSTPDIDNLLKFVLDAGNKIIWKDDSLICKVDMQKVYGRETKTEIEIIYGDE